MNITGRQASVLITALEAFGERQQVIKAIEELSELNVELAKFLNMNPRLERGDNFAVTDAVIDEVADAAIMIYQMVILFGADDVHARVEQKVQRLFEKIKAEVQK